ncbi:MAG: endonuclease III [Verrucomicrobiota bacterium]
MNRRTVLTVYRKLARAYGPLPHTRRGNPLDELVATILSQNTSDVNSGRAFASLRRRFPRWSQVAAARPSQIADAIRQGGLANIKAPRIREVLRIIGQREGAITLRRLRSMTNAEAIGYLTSMPGVGIKTAACVLLFSLGRPVMPVDTHVYRVTRRLDWIGDRIRIEDAGPELQEDVPDRLIYGMHIYLVWHGRRTCKARRPLCDICPIRMHCRFCRRRFLSSRTKP